MLGNTRKDMVNIAFSVVVPIYNEAENIEQLNKEIKEVMDKLRRTYEVIYVNDGSTDNSLNKLKQLKKVKIINLNRNYGQATSLDAGFKASQGEIIISLDGDLQNDSSDIPKMIQKLLKEDLDVVAGWRKHRKDKQGVRVLTRIGRFLRSFLIRDRVHDSGCTLRVYRKNAVKNLDIGGEMHRYILAILRWKGFRIGELEVNHRQRAAGKSKYGYEKALRGFIDLVYIWFIMKFSQRPLHIFGSLGILSFFLGIFAEAWMVKEKLTQGIDLSNNAWFILGFFLIIMGIVLFSFGIVIDMLIKTHFNTSQNEKRYNIRDVIIN